MWLPSWCLTIIGAAILSITNFDEIYHPQLSLDHVRMFWVYLSIKVLACDTLSRIWRQQKSHKSNHTVKTNYDCYFIFSLKNWCCCQYPHACRTMVWNYQLKHNPNRDFLYLLMTKSGIERGKAKWRIAWASVQILSVFLFVCGAGICLPCYFIKILMQSMLRSSILFHSHVVQILHIVLKHITQI